MSSPVGSHQLTDKEKRVILDAIAFLSGQLGLNWTHEIMGWSDGTERTI